jgi:hypothetical protein
LKKTKIDNNEIIDELPLPDNIVLIRDYGKNKQILNELQISETTLHMLISLKKEIEELELNINNYKEDIYSQVEKYPVYNGIKVPFYNFSFLWGFGVLNEYYASHSKSCTEMIFSPLI